MKYTQTMKQTEKQLEKAGSDIQAFMSNHN